MKKETKLNLWYNFHIFLNKTIWKLLRILCYFRIHLYSFNIGKEVNGYYEKVMMSYTCRICDPYNWKGMCAAPDKFQPKDKPKSSYDGVIDGY